jgi:hypothetical protein
VKYVDNCYSLGTWIEMGVNAGEKSWGTCKHVTNKTKKGTRSIWSTLLLLFRVVFVYYLYFHSLKRNSFLWNH